MPQPQNVPNLVRHDRADITEGLESIRSPIAVRWPVRGHIRHVPFLECEPNLILNERVRKRRVEAWIEFVRDVIRVPPPMIRRKSENV